MKFLKDLLRAMLILTVTALVLSGVIPVRAEIPSNDDFGSPFIIETLPYVDMIDTREATTAGDDPSPCGTYPYNSVWYQYTATDSLALTASTSGSSYNAALGVYELDEFNNLLSLDCSTYNNPVTIHVGAGKTLYFLAVDMNLEDPYPIPGDEGGGWLQFSVSGASVSRPANDDFANAQLITGLPYFEQGNIEYASIEPPEANPNCGWGGIYRSVWFQFTPNETQAVEALLNSSFAGVIMVYTGSELENLTPVACRSGFYSLLTFLAEAGKTHYIQIGSMEEGLWDWYYTFDLYAAPPPEADFYYWPQDPSVYDQVNFCSTNISGSGGISEFGWLFPGDVTERTGECQSYRFPEDKDYIVQHRIQTLDGREASITKTIEVRTHDVSIVKVTVPITAKSNQTKEISIGIRNTRYPEVVLVELYKSTPYGYEWVGGSRISVPARSNGRTTEFVFNYTFTAEDARVGKVTFKAVANLENARDALPADNEYLSFPVKVSR